jgi:hypothetical protein
MRVVQRIRAKSVDGRRASSPDNMFLAQWGSALTNKRLRGGAGRKSEFGGLQLADDVDDMLHFLSKRCANALCLR